MRCRKVWVERPVADCFQDAGKPRFQGIGWRRARAMLSTRMCGAASLRGIWWPSTVEKEAEDLFAAMRKDPDPAMRGHVERVGLSLAEESALESALGGTY